jgi:hypothetical protein
LLDLFKVERSVHARLTPRQQCRGDKAKVIPRRRGGVAESPEFYFVRDADGRLHGDTLAAAIECVNRPGNLVEIEKPMTMHDGNQGSLLSLTMSARLDRALQSDWAAWQGAIEQEGTDRFIRWIVHRLRKSVPAELLTELARDYVEASDLEARSLAAADLAEVVADDDPTLADMLWEGVSVAGKELNDSELIFEAALRQASIAEEFGDPLAAAEFFIDFLNWRRSDNEHVSDPEAVFSSFDEIIRLAEADSAPAPAARYAHDQAVYGRLADAEDPSALAGDWAPGTPPFRSWD